MIGRLHRADFQHTGGAGVSRIGLDGEGQNGGDKKKHFHADIGRDLSDGGYTNLSSDRSGNQRSCAARNLSASIAAAQPMPAAVIAWR